MNDCISKPQELCHGVDFRLRYSALPACDLMLDALMPDQTTETTDG